MNNYISTTVKEPFETAIHTVTDALSQEGFGVITDVDVQATMKSKLGIDFRNYRILGACNPPSAHKALEADDKVGLMLPCNVIVQEGADETIEIAAVDPVSTLGSEQNETLRLVAQDVRGRLQRALESVDRQRATE